MRSTLSQVSIGLVKLGIMVDGTYLGSFLGSGGCSGFHANLFVCGFFGLHGEGDFLLGVEDVQGCTLLGILDPESFLCNCLLSWRVYITVRSMAPPHCKLLRFMHVVARHADSTLYPAKRHTVVLCDVPLKV